MMLAHSVAFKWHSGPSALNAETEDTELKRKQFFGAEDSQGSQAMSVLRQNRKKTSDMNSRHFEGCSNDGYRSLTDGSWKAVPPQTNKQHSSVLLDDGKSCTDGIKLQDFSGGIITTTCCTPATSLFCAGCAHFDQTNNACTKCLGGYQNIGGRCVVCTDLEGFVDPLTQTCLTYESNNWCANGVPDEQAWRPSSNTSDATMDQFKFNGVAPTTACCACGGGVKAPTPFMYPAARKPLLLNVPVNEVPEPQTAQEYAADPACELYALGLSLNATTGAITGTPRRSEPFDLDCTITAKESSLEGLEYNFTF
eukprot:TRINITY_DN65793_c0_g1_i1.p1 TRINITY_DN65793_c0_g1~~TRINITY_DN65793_c0_g1_i1.p1  ORF type:complete len:345 (-),score=52.76 TRINITY_DN65793_c0_g1_i1:128-1057(-)